MSQDMLHANFQGTKKSVVGWWNVLMPCFELLKSTWQVTVESRMQDCTIHTLENLKFCTMKNWILQLATCYPYINFSMRVFPVLLHNLFCLYRESKVSSQILDFLITADNWYFCDFFCTLLHYKNYKSVLAKNISECKNVAKPRQTSSLNLSGLYVLQGHAI